MEKEHGKETMAALEKYYPSRGQLSQFQAMQILKLVYHGVPEAEIIRCAILCRDFGLHPLKKEVYIIPFGQGEKRTWATVIGIAADRKMAANQKGAYSFLDDTPRAASKKEIAKQFGEDSEEAESNLISVCKVKGQDGNDVIGFGLWPKENNPYGIDKGNTKRNMANIRAERQALSRLPGRPLPQVEVIDEAYAELPEVGTVDTATGEIVETKPEPKPKGAEKKEPKKPAPTPAPKVPQERTEQKAEPPDEETQPEPQTEETPSPIDLVWLKETLGIIRWKETTALSWIKAQFRVSVEGSLADVLKSLEPKLLKEFYNHIASMRESSGH